MIKFYKNKNIRLKTKIVITISKFALFLAIANLFINNEIVREIIWLICIIAFILEILSDSEDINRLQKENLLQDYEIYCLRCSYRGMGDYIEYKNLPELEDINIRISNELIDIEIKKEDYAKRLGIKP